MSAVMGMLGLWKRLASSVLCYSEKKVCLDPRDSSEIAEATLEADQRSGDHPQARDGPFGGSLPGKHVCPWKGNHMGMRW